MFDETENSFWLKLLLNIFFPCVCCLVAAQLLVHTVCGDKVVILYGQLSSDHMFRKMLNVKLRIISQSLTIVKQSGSINVSLKWKWDVKNYSYQTLSQGEIKFSFIVFIYVVASCGFLTYWYAYFSKQAKKANKELLTWQLWHLWNMEVFSRVNYRATTWVGLFMVLLVPILMTT